MHALRAVSAAGRRPGPQTGLAALSTPARRSSNLRRRCSFKVRTQLLIKPMSGEVHAEIVNSSDHFFYSHGLALHQLILPLGGVRRAENARGIVHKILMNNSSLVTEFNSEESISLRGRTAKQSDMAVEHIKKLVPQLIDANKQGFVLVLGFYHLTEALESFQKKNRGEKEEQKAMLHEPIPFEPLAGGLVIAKDETEREVGPMWCNRELPDFTTKSICTAFSLRLLSEALTFRFETNKRTGKDWGTKRPGEKALSAPCIISIPELSMQAFPEEAVDFLLSETGMGMTSHIEANGKYKFEHVDQPRDKCKCTNRTQFGEEEQFYCIGDRRFTKVYKQHKQAFSGRVPWTYEEHEAMMTADGGHADIIMS
eukprot:GHVU01215756.1.p2 GENE.GHVU01215756.1~~GHVU01215756.1.p2  ORF type:complete len:369 (+),score=48.33 GHVU01215756.1:1895-3001(+)